MIQFSVCEFGREFVVVVVVTSKSSQDEVVPSTPQQTSNTSPELNKKPTNNKSESDFPSNSVITSVITSLISGNKEVEKQSDIGGATDTCHDGCEFIENSLGRRSVSSLNDFKDDNSTNEQNGKLNKSTSRNSLQLGQGVRENVNLTSNLTTAKKVKSNTNSFCQNNKDETITRSDNTSKHFGVFVSCGFLTFSGFSDRTISHLYLYSFC